MSPDTRARAWLAKARRRLRYRGLSLVTTAAAAATGATAALLFASGYDGARLVWPAVVAGIGVAILTAWRAWPSWSLRSAAIVTDRRAGLDNLLVTAEEIDRRAVRLRPSLGDEIWRQVDERMASVDLSFVIPLARPLGLAGAASLAAALVVWSLSAGVRGAVAPSLGPGGVVAGPTDIDSVVVTITPPAYVGRDPEVLNDPVALRALEGSTVRLEVTSGAARVELAGPGGAPADLVRADGVFSLEMPAADPRVLLLRPYASDGHAGAERLITLGIDPDRRPTVRVVEPADDLLVPTPETRVTIALESADDLALGSLELTYTRVSGSGESFSFTEGDVPVTISRDDARAWRALGVIDLAALGLGDGDMLVYRARARDLKPGGAPAESASYLISIGREGGMSSEGFALPEAEDRYAISQQMVIMRTEALHGRRGELPPDVWAEETQGLAVEQRMVRTESVFLSGGEVQDEVEEAEHSHELAAGRLENRNQIELFNAIRAMSRAEIALNGGDTAVALVYEREALAALQKAFERRRYFLRTLPERARIDTTRRLSGDREDASSWNREAEQQAAPELSKVRTLVNALAAARGKPASVTASLAADVAAFDTAWPELQQAAIAMVNDPGETGRLAALDAAIVLLVDRARTMVAPVAADEVPHDPLAGRVADQRSGGGQR